MKIGQITVLLLAGFLSFSAVADEKIESFNSIRASGDVDIHIVSDPGQYDVSVDGEGDVEISVIDNTLYIHSSALADEQQRPVATIQVDGLHALSYIGSADVVAENLNSALLDLNLNTHGRVALQGKIGLRDLHVQGSGEVDIEGINSRDLAVTMTGNPTVTLRGSADLKTLDYSGSGQLNVNWVTGAELTVNGSGEAYVQLTGKVKNLQVVLTDAAHFNGKSLHAEQAYVQTYQQSLARISVTDKQNTLASDESDIYYYQEPAFKTDFMADDGSVLSMVNAPARSSQQSLK